MEKLLYDTDEIDSTPYSKLVVFSYSAITHGHTFFEFTLVLEGSCNSVINNGKNRVLQKGDLIFIRPGDTHMINPITKNYRHRDFYVTEEKMKRICSAFSDTLYAELMAPKLPLEYRVEINEYSLIEDKAGIFNQNTLHSSNTEKSLDQIHTSLIVQLVSIILFKNMPTDDRAPQWLKTLFLHLSSFHYINHSVDDIVKLTGYSHTHVCKTFKSTYGTTLIDCLNKSKVLLSTNLLGKQKIIDIALSLGWDNPKNYTIAFKKVFGITPSEYAASRTLPIKTVPKAKLVYPNPPRNTTLDDLP